MKPRSRDVTDGLEKAAARGMLRAVGMGDDDFAKSQIGVASSWNEITPCNLSLDRLAKAVKEGVFEAGGFPMEFGTISVSDGISMGHEGMHFSLVSREIIADSVETVMQAERLDGSVLLAGCDKSLPGMLMAAARLDLASVFLYAGSILPGRATLSDGTEMDVTIIDAFEAVGACARGLMSRADVDAIERAICPGEGACGGMYTANTMASAAEAMGMSLPGSAAPPATGGLEMRIHASLKVKARQLRHVAAQLQLHVQPRLHFGLGGHARTKIGKIDGDAVAIARPDVVHICVEVLRRRIERNRAIVHDSKPIRQFHLARLQIEQGILHGLGARAWLPGNRLIRVAVLVDDQMKVRLFHAKIVQRNVRLRALADRVREEGVDAQAQKDLGRGEIRHLTGALAAMDHQIVGLNRKMPKVE